VTIWNIKIVPLGVL